MPNIPKKQDKPNDPPYAGGEDEAGKDQEPKHEANDFPVDETDDGPT
jgi:hypothetical protein